MIKRTTHRINRNRISSPHLLLLFYSFFFFTTYHRCQISSATVLREEFFWSHISHSLIISQVENLRSLSWLRWVSTLKRESLIVLLFWLRVEIRKWDVTFQKRIFSRFHPYPMSQLILSANSQNCRRNFPLARKRTHICSYQKTEPRLPNTL